MADHFERLRAALADRYAIEREIGAGGMATVYLAEDLKHDRKVAVKVLRPELAAVLGGERFLNEIKLTANLQHPHILPLHDSGAADSLFYYVMPYVEGESLREKLNRQRRLSIDEALRISGEVADALGSAHRQGVVHRDIKPENVLLREGHALVTDFGIALAVTEAGGQRLTETGLSLGTPAYMSPEQVAGDREIDGRSDIYSLACVLYEMLAGDPPFLASSSQAVLARHVTDPAPPIATVRPDVPRPVAAALAKALSKTPADRFECATALKEAMFSESAKPESQTKSIVVLPFENLSSDPDQDYFSDGLTEEIISDLSNVRALRVISRSSAMTYKGSNKRIPEIARELNVRYVLEGSVRKGGDNLRVTAQLIDSTDDTHLWAEKYTGRLGDVFEMQESVSRRIMDALQVTLTCDEEQRLATRAVPDLRAFDRCLRARQALYGMTETGLDLALELIREALEITGPNALLYATLAEDYYAQQEGMVRLEEKPLELGASWVAKSLALNPDNPVALRSRGLICYKRGDIEGALRDLHRSAELQADGVSYGWLGWLCGMAGSMSTARQFTNRAVSLDPMFRIGCLLPGWLALLDGDFDTALDQARLVVDLSEEEPWGVLWLAIFAFTAQQGDEARKRLMQIITSDEVPSLWKTTCTLLHALTHSDAEAVRRCLSSTEFIEVAKVDWTLSWLLGDVFAQLGESVRALHWLENTLELGFMNRQFFSRVDPLLEPLRSQESFHAVMDHMSERQRRIGRVDPVRALVEAREISSTR